MTATLKLGRGFALPLDLVTEATAIVATRGAGKSSASAVIVEEAFAVGVQAVIFDRTGVYWGLRSNKAGDGPGLGIYVLGGPHGDVPLESNAGVLIADLVVDSGHSFVLDLSDFSKSAAVKFAADFLERLYDRKARSRTTTLLILDEAHFYAPQTPRGGFKGDSARLMGAMEDVVGLGRSRGLGVVLTTQRTQALNKAVLDLIETLLVMRMLSPRARDAVQDWIREKHEDDREGVIATLESLPTGTAWVWSPLRGILEKVAVRRIKTFDSYATPKPGETRVEPKARKELDLDKLGERIAATVERAKASDPAQLQKRVRELERESDERLARIRELEAEPSTVEVEKVVEVSVLTDDDRYLLAKLEICKDSFEQWRTDLAALTDVVERATSAARAPVAKREPAPVAVPRVKPKISPDPRRKVAAETNGTSAAIGEPVKAGARRIVETLARHYPMRVTRAQLGTLTGFKITGGTFQTYFSQLKRLGLIVDNAGEISITEEGLAFAGVAPSEPMTTEELLAMWRGALKAGARQMLDVLVANYPASLGRDQLAELVEMVATGGTFQAYLSTLRRNGLIEVSGGEIVASDTLFIGSAHA